jgi:hypothetical protein
MSASTGIAGRLDEQPELVEHAARIEERGQNSCSSRSRQRSISRCAA